jgi:hypothetical protein
MNLHVHRPVGSQRLAEEGFVQLCADLGGPASYPICPDCGQNGTNLATPYSVDTCPSCPPPVQWRIISPLDDVLTGRHFVYEGPVDSTPSQRHAISFSACGPYIRLENWKLEISPEGRLQLPTRSERDAAWQAPPFYIEPQAGNLERLTIPTTSVAHPCNEVLIWDRKKAVFCLPPRYRPT